MTPPADHPHGEPDRPTGSPAAAVRLSPDETLIGGAGSPAGRVDGPGSTVPEFTQRPALGTGLSSAPENHEGPSGPADGPVAAMLGGPQHGSRSRTGDPVSSGRRAVRGFGWRRLWSGEEAWVRRWAELAEVASRPVDEEELGIRRRRRYGFLFAAVWAVYLNDPVRKAWQLDDPVARVYTLLVIFAFAVAYIGSYWLLVRGPVSKKPYPVPTQLRVVVLPLLVQALLILAAAVTLHSEVYGMTVYLVSFTAFALPSVRAIPVLLVLILGSTVVPQVLTGHPPDWSLMQSMALAGFAVGGIRIILLRNAQLYQVRKQLTELAVAEERLRVGRDVHDILGHSLTVITVKTELAQRLMDLDPERAKAEMADVERLARESLAGVRATVGGLREVSLAGELTNARTALRAAEIDADLPDTDELPLRHSVVFGWVLREAVTNVVRHSGASCCRVRVTPTSIEVLDDGIGLRDGARFGSGLSGLRERVQATGGSLTMGNRPEGGLRVLASFPAGPTKEPE